MIKYFSPRFKLPKIKSFAIVYALFIMLIITIFISSILFWNYYNNLYANNIIIEDRLINNAESGINFAMENLDKINNDSTKKYTFFDDGISVNLYKKQWGIYNLLISVANIRNASKKRMVLTGDCRVKNEKICLYISDVNKPLTVCGNTLINGDICSPLKEIKRGYIEGKSYSANSTKGQMITFNNEYKLNDTKIKNFEYSKIKNYFLQSNSNKITEFKEIKSDTIFNSFSNQTIVIYEKNPINIINKCIKGNVVIISDKLIKANASDFLEDVILIAPGIIFSDNFTGKLQSIASDSIVTGNNCNFLYPSSFVVEDNKSQGKQLIKFSDKNIFLGTVIMYKANESNNKNVPYLSVPVETTLNGQIISNGFVEHKGIVYGTIYCQRFILSTRASFYENHILDATIDPTKIHKDFTGISYQSVKNNNVSNIIKCLY